MFSKKLQGITALMLCAALFLCLGGCAETPIASDGTEGNDTLPGYTEPEPTPRELLSAALDAAWADLEERFGSSPLAGLTGLAPDGVISAEVDVSFPDEQGELAGSLAGSVIYSARTGEARADLVISTDSIPMNIYYGPEFLGISCRKVFGDDTFYGLRPYDLAEQLTGSALQELLSLDMDAVAQLDALLEAVPKDVNVFTAPETDQILRACHELIDELDLTAQTAEGGTLYSAVIPADTLADFVRRLTTAAPDWVLLYGMGTGDGGAAAVEEAIEAIRSSGVGTPVTFTVADGKLTHISTRYEKDGGTVNVEAELYGGSGSALVLTVDPQFSFTLDLAAGAVMDLTTTDGAVTKFSWTPEGDFEFITYRGDVTDLCLDGTLNAENGSVSFEGIWYSGERGDRNPLTFTTAPGGVIEAPSSLRNITELSTRELYAALMKIVFNLF